MQSEIAQKCTDICGGIFGGSISTRKEKAEMGRVLAQYLIDAGSVSTLWICSKGYKDSIMYYLRYLSDEQCSQLLEKGLDLNLQLQNGVVPFTWSIGNAENEWVYEMLEMSAKYQTLEQRLIWINKTDSMIRFTETCPCARYKITPVQQTALQLTIAKGYEDIDGCGNQTCFSNFQIAEKLLSLGADVAINYQEPTKGNTALHIAFARRDLKSVELLILFGASLGISNLEGKKPGDMSRLSFSQTETLLDFHTSPDGHPSTFVLKKLAFNDKSTLKQLSLAATESFFSMRVRD